MPGKSNNGYNVGFGKPPKEHQWAPGQSGNPSGGRKKNSKDKVKAKPLIDGLAEELSRIIPFQINGETKELSMGEILAKVVCAETMKADVKTKILLIKELSKLGVLDLQRTNLQIEGYEEDEPVFSEEDRRLFDIAQQGSGL